MIDTKKEREKNLDAKLEKVIENKANTEIEINYQRTLPPEEMSAKKPLKIGFGGQPSSWQEIKRSEHIGILEDKLADLNVLIQIIEDLY